MSKKRLKWNDELWTIVEEADGGVLFVPDNKSYLSYDFLDYANGLVEGVVLYPDFGISYTAESWADFWSGLELKALGKDYYLEFC
jgi:hypothetical protein